MAMIKAQIHPLGAIIGIALFFFGTIFLVYQSYDLGYSRGYEKAEDDNDATWKKLSIQMKGMGICEYATLLMEKGPYGDRGLSCKDMDGIHP